jgi:hypothetical protein
MSGSNNPYAVEPFIPRRSERLIINKTVQVSTQWVYASNLEEAFSQDKWEIMHRENFIGTVVQIHPSTDEVSVKFGNSAQWRDNCYVWVPRSQVRILR